MLLICGGGSAPTQPTAVLDAGLRGKVDGRFGDGDVGECLVDRGQHLHQSRAVQQARVAVRAGQITNTNISPHRVSTPCAEPKD